jgi:hypothetical protein
MQALLKSAVRRRPFTLVPPKAGPHPPFILALIPYQALFSY